jgi:hypothetical protein
VYIAVRQDDAQELGAIQQPFINHHGFESQLGAIKLMLQHLPSTKEPTWTWENILSTRLPLDHIRLQVQFRKNLLMSMVRRDE